jgi:hypothetical protein
MDKLKERGGISSGFQLALILLVFSLTGSAALYVAKPFLSLVGLERGSFPDAWWSNYVYWTLRLLLIFPFYQVILLLFGFMFGQFRFFWNFEKKMLCRLGMGFLLK